MNKEEINKILNDWWDAETTCSENCQVECDLCTDCFFDLKERFGLERSLEDKA